MLPRGSGSLLDFLGLSDVSFSKIGIDQSDRLIFKSNANSHDKRAVEHMINMAVVQCAKIHRKRRASRVIFID